MKDLLLELCRVCPERFQVNASYFSFRTNIGLWTNIDLRHFPNVTDSTPFRALLWTMLQQMRERWPNIDIDERLTEHPEYPENEALAELLVHAQGFEIDAELILKTYIAWQKSKLPSPCAPAEGEGAGDGGSLPPGTRKP